MKKTLTISLCIVLAMILSGCSDKDTLSQNTPSTGNEIPPDIESVPVNIEEEYKKACDLVLSGENLRAAQIFMSIYDYKDSFSQYNDLILHNHISVNEVSIGILTNAGNVNVIGRVSSFIQKELEEWNDIVAIASHEFGIIGLKKDGTVLSTTATKKTKWYAGAEVVDGWSDIVDIACGFYHTVGLKSDGTVVATEYIGDIGYNKGQCNLEDWTDIVSIAAGSKHTVGLRKDGTVVAKGDNSKGQCNTDRWTDIVAISASMDKTLGLKSDGTVIFTRNAEIIEASKWSDIVYATVGPFHAVGLKSDGTVLSVGSNNNGECNTQNWSDMLYAIAYSSVTLGVKADGTIIFIGNESFSRNKVNGYNLFTGDKGDLELPFDFPSDIPLYEKNEILKVSETNEATVIAFSVNASADDTFEYYEKWCSERGGYLKQPYQDDLYMLISPMNDIKKAVTFISTNGIKLEDGTIIDSTGVIIMIQGGEKYESVANLK